MKHRKGAGMQLTGNSITPSEADGGVRSGHCMFPLARFPGPAAAGTANFSKNAHFS
jgi:hypothetical protein